MFPNTKMPKNDVLLNWVTVQQNFVEIAGQRGLEIQRIWFQVGLFFLSCPHSVTFLRKCIQTNNLSFCTLRLMNLDEQQELFFTQNARRGWAPKLDLMSRLLFTVSSSGQWNFIVGVFFSALCSWDILSKRKSALWLIYKVTLGHLGTFAQEGTFSLALM